MQDNKTKELIRPELVSKFQEMTDTLMTTDRHELDHTIEHSIDGISSEAGEMVDAVKRVKWYGTKFDKVNMLEECGDMLFYLDKLIRACNSDFNEVIEMNMKKLAERYKDHKFTKDHAVNRDTDKERVVLEDAAGGILPLKLFCRDCVKCGTNKCFTSTPTDDVCAHGFKPKESAVNSAVEVRKTCNTCVKCYAIKNPCTRSERTFNSKDCTNYTDVKI